MECLRPLRSGASDSKERYGGASRPLSFGFEPSAWPLECAEGDRHTREFGRGQPAPLARAQRDVGHEQVIARRGILDAIVLRPRYLYELSGEASAGKTQLCLQLIVRAVLSGQHSEELSPSLSSNTFNRAVYLFTEGGTVKMDRLRQIVASRLGDDGMTDAVMRHVHVEYASTVDDVIAKLIILEDVLRDGCGPWRRRGVGGVDGAEVDGGGEYAEYGECNKSNKPPVRLLVIDSIAHVFRFREDDRYEASVTRYDTSRTHAFFKIASILKRYADEYNLVVLVTNQVVDAIDDGHGGEQDRPGCAGLKLETSGRVVYPALGLAWSSCVNARFCIIKETAMCNKALGKRQVIVERDSGGKQLRSLQVVFSPELKQVKTHFTIETQGCVGVDVGSVCLGFGDG